MNIKDELTCKHCNEIYTNPITLTCCGENFCKQHVAELTLNYSSNKFTCPLCNQENSNQNLNVNKLIQKMVENELHKFQINSKYRETLESLKHEVRKMETILKDPENVIYEEISELKRQVDLDRERLKSEIDELADGLIKQLEEYEAKFKKEYKVNVDFDVYNGLLDSYRKQLAEYEKCLNLFSTNYRERKNRKKSSEKVINRLQYKINEVKKKLFSNLSITFKPITSTIKDLFSQLIVKVFLL